jgi:hypothetical protein
MAASMDWWNIWMPVRPHEISAPLTSPLAKMADNARFHP